MDKISIIVPVYNVQPYLERCIVSLLEQTYNNTEILLVDDCSKDGSRALIEQYAARDSRIRPIFQESNLGVSVARNRALDLMNGDWVCFCDADDWYEKNLVEKMLECAEKENSDYIICNYQIVSDNRPALISGSVEGLYSGCDPKLVVACGPTSSCTHMIKRSLFEVSNVRYPVGCRQYEELPVIPVLAKYAKRIGVVHAPLYNYYQRGDGSSASNAALESEQNFLHSWKLTREALGEGYQLELEYHAIYSLFYGEILKLCKMGVSSSKIREKIKTYEGLCPNYMRNPYLSRMGSAKRTFVYLCRYRVIAGLRFLAWLHQKIVS